MGCFAWTFALLLRSLPARGSLSQIISTADWNFRASSIYVPDGRNFGAANRCAFRLLELSELTLSKRECDGNRCQHHCILEAGAATEHHEDLQKGLSDAFRSDWGGIFLIRNLNLHSDQPDLLLLSLPSLQLLPRWHCSTRAIPASVLQERRPELSPLHQSNKLVAFLWRNALF